MKNKSKLFGLLSLVSAFSFMAFVSVQAVDQELEATQSQPCYNSHYYSENLEIVEHAKNTILIDAGHGGFDTGAKHFGFYEKDFTLAVSFRLRELIQESSFAYVELTRTEDVFMYLDDRIEMSENADLLVSIHTAAPDLNQFAGIVSLHNYESEEFAINATRSLAEFLNLEYKLLSSVDKLVPRLVAESNVPTVIIDVVIPFASEYEATSGMEAFINEVAENLYVSLKQNFIKQ